MKERTLLFISYYTITGSFVCLSLLHHNWLAFAGWLYALGTVGSLHIEKNKHP